jgi:hypothetical protein
MMSALDRHPVAQVEIQFRILRGRGWKIVQGKFGNYWTVTCKAGTMTTRIYGRSGRGLRSQTALQQITNFVAKHDAKHPRE